jgi:hypothetical protein
MKSIKLFVFSLLLFVGVAVQSQTTIENVLDIKYAKQSGAIYEEEKIIGYYTFFFKEKSDKKNSVYEVSVYDDNYVLKKSFEIKRAKNTFLANTQFNGTTFLFEFIDQETGLEIVTFDKSGKELAKLLYNVKEMKKMKMGITHLALNGKGFLQLKTQKNKKKSTYQLILVDNTLKKTWEYASNANSNVNEALFIENVGDKYITANVSTFKKITSTKNRTSNYIALNIETGKKEFDFKFDTDKETANKLYLRNVFNENDKSLTFVGEFYKPGSNMYGTKSLGVFVQKLDASGKQSQYKEYKWKGDLDKFKMAKVDEEDKKDAEKPYYTFIHDVIFSKNGHLFLVGEQFKKQVSAKAVASKVALSVLAAATGVNASSNVSNFEVRLANMIVIELDETSKLVDFEMINKKKRSVLLPNGAGIQSSTMLGFIVKSMNEFDYEFTSRNKEKDKYSVLYFDSDKKEFDSKVKADIMLGIININEGILSYNKAPYSSNATKIWVSPAKPGYVTITEYFRKEKKLVYHLEPLSY